MPTRNALATIALVLLILLPINVVQATVARAQCRPTWQDVLWPEESTCKPDPTAVPAVAPPSLSVSYPPPGYIVGESIRVSPPDDNDEDSDNDDSDDNGDSEDNQESADNDEFGDNDSNGTFFTQSGSQTNPLAICKDGTLDFSSNRSDACNGHGGVSTWLR